MKPVRIQRKRTKGYDMQAESRSINGIECVYVGRPTKFGNPFFVGWDGDGDHEQCWPIDALQPHFCCSLSHEHHDNVNECGATPAEALRAAIAVAKGE